MMLFELWAEHPCSLAIVQRGPKWQAETKVKEEEKRDEMEDKKRRKEENAVAALASGNSGAVGVGHEGKNRDFAYTRLA
jgi:hypothetical protein